MESETRLQDSHKHLYKNMNPDMARSAYGLNNQNMYWDPRPPTHAPGSQALNIYTCTPRTPIQCTSNPKNASTPLDFQHIHLYPRSQHMQLHRTFRPPNTPSAPQTLQTSDIAWVPDPNTRLSSRDHSYILQHCACPGPLTPQPAQLSLRLLIIQPKIGFHRIPERPV